MKICAIISEYNPFHRGHEYQILQTRELLGADTGLICLMSGNFVQRGEPAIFDKHARAKAAVLCGADLVLELPLPYSISSAEGFGFGAVYLLDRLRCVDYLSFGSECGDISQLKSLAELFKRPEMDGLIKRELKGGIPYARARQLAAESLAGNELSLLAERNNLLGIEYIKALIKLGSGIEPITVKRNFEFKSASELRRTEGFLDELPVKAAAVYAEEILAGRGCVRPQNIETAVLMKLRTMRCDDFAALPDCSEGLENRLMKYSGSESLQKFYRDVSTKRYPEARIRRMTMCAYLGIKAGMAEKYLPDIYARVLAVGVNGRDIINKISGNITVITKPAHGKGNTLFELNARATDLYVLGHPGTANRRGGSEWTRSPFVL
jgi:predicted nucleotidyltransferase